MSEKEEIIDVAHERGYADGWAEAIGAAAGEARQQCPHALNFADCPHLTIEECTAQAILALKPGPSDPGVAPEPG